ncbi:MAG: PAS domain S-box protein, partial [Syntrophales bacterium]
MTEKELKDQELREINERYDQLALQSGSFAWEVDARGLYTYVNPSCQAVLGYRPDELVGRMHFYDLHPEAGREEFKQAALAVFEQQGSFKDLDNAAQTRDGRLLWLSTTGLPLLNADGSLRGYRGMDADISARKQMEEDLRRSRDNLTAVMEAIPDLLFELDEAGYYRQVYATQKHLLAAPAEVLLGKNVRDIMPIDASTAIFEALQAAGLKGTDYGRTIKLPLEDGERWFELSIARKSREAEKALHFIVLSRDITERKQKEAQDLLEQMVAERAKQLRQEAEAPLAEGNDTVLLVDDEPSVISALSRALRNCPYQLLTAGNARQALEIMETTKLKVIVSDEMMVGMRGSELLAEVQKRFPHTIRILLTGHATLEAATRAVNQGGIYRFLTKPWDDALLRLALSAATEKYNSAAEKRILAEDLRKSEQALQATLDGLSGHIAQLDDRGTIMLVNNAWRAYAEQSGIRGDSVCKGANYLKVCDEATGEHSEEAAGFARGIRAVLSGELDQYLMEYSCDLPGREQWFVGRVSSFSDEKPRRAVVVAHMDITERKQAERVLLEQEAQRLANAYNRTLIEVSVDPLVTIGPDGKITDVNTATEHATGYTGKELIGTDFSTYFSQPAKAQQAFEQVFRDGVIQNIELELCHRNGSVIQALYNFAVYRNEAREVVGVFAAARDITDRKRAEEVLRTAREAAEAANRAKSLFIGNMSHELRTPLSGVLGMTEALLNTPVTQQQRDYAETIRKSGKALLAVVSDILDFSKIEAGKMTLNSAPFLVESVIANVVNLFGPPAAEEKIGLHTTMDSEIPVLRGDTHRLTQVVNNLVGNAIKFTKKGEIQVTAKILRRTETEVELAIGVQDTGIGMTE